MAQRASWVSGAADECAEFLLAARLASLLLLDLRFLGGIEEEGAGGELRVAMADTSFSLVLFLGTRREFERTGALGWGALGLFTLELFCKALGMGSRGFLGIGALELTLFLFLGTVFLISKRRDWAGAGSWTQLRWLWWKGEVTQTLIFFHQKANKIFFSMILYIVYSSFDKRKRRKYSPKMYKH